MGRIVEIDFVKGVLISLMVLFHLNLFAETYENVTEWVYSFHMSGFLLISGYFQKTEGNLQKLWALTRKIFIPYIIFETVYLIGLYLLGEILGSQNQASLTLDSACERLFLSPAGTYWYLHTLFICIVVCFSISWLKLNSFVSWMLTGCVLFVLTFFIGGLSWGNIIYFMTGSLLNKLGLGINKAIQPSLLSVIPIVIISAFTTNLSRAEWSGMGLTFFMLSLLMALYVYLPSYCQDIISKLGKNSLCIVLFSPIFTVLTKQYVNLFQFDSSHIVWAFISLLAVLILCITCAKLCDKLRISFWIAGGNLYNV